MQNLTKPAQRLFFTVVLSLVTVISVNQILLNLPKTNASESNVNSPNKTTVTAPLDIQQTSTKLTELWIKDLDVTEWLFLSYKEEFTYDVGVDPETNTTLPQKALWEVWYELNDSDLPTAVITRRTDLDNGNVWYSIWKDDIALNLPANSKRGYQWNYRPIHDHFCHVQLIAPTLVEPGVTREISEQRINEQWQVTISTAHPPANFTNDDKVYVANEAICIRDIPTGVLQSIEHVAITNTSERILMQRTYEFQAVAVPTPPSDISALLEQLNDTQTK